MKRLPTLLLVLCPFLSPARAWAGQASPEAYAPPLAEGTERTWIGPEFWGDRVGDWRLADGRIECVESGDRRPVRALHLLTATLADRPGSFRVAVRLGALAPAPGGEDTWAGFLIGAGGTGIDYRLTALCHHRPAPDGGILCVVDGRGQAVFRDFEHNVQPGHWGIAGPLAPDEVGEIAADDREGYGFGGRDFRPVDLVLSGAPSAGGYRLSLLVLDASSGALLSLAGLDGIDPRLVEGNVALASHRGPGDASEAFWFRDWSLEGDKLERHPERAHGPILATQYTLSGGTLKMAVQLPPLGADDPRTALLEVPDGEGGWREAARAECDPDAFNALLRVEGWDAREDVPYRVRVELRRGPQAFEESLWEGVVRAEPGAERPFVLAAFTGNKHFTGGIRWNGEGVWFPHTDLVRAVAAHDPDLLFFSGDQLYEGDLTGAQRSPADAARLDYLDKWYRWCWAFGDLARDRPCITIPDDHDVYHGNIWGAGGRHAKRQDDGGYRMPARFVRMVERTQTSHLPDAADPRPVEQGIGVYFTNLRYAGIDFAILEDRKFKSSPTVLVPDGDCRNGWFHAPGFDPAESADVPGAVLLGERQLAFLREWGTDWSGGTWMKVVLSQTIFANVATLPAAAKSDGVVPSLVIPEPGEYPSGDHLAADGDSNGWPQTGRNRALRELRRAFALHVAGDQHLASLVHYGVEEWDDAGWALCVPSVANTFPRRWFPPQPGLEREAGAPAYTGRFRDGFGNRITVHAVSNPVRSGHTPAALHDRAPGYGIVRLDPRTREITLECWPRWVDPTASDAACYPGWPRTVHQLDNYARSAAAWLPELRFRGGEGAVVGVIDAESGEPLYTLRVPGETFRPWTFRAGPHRLRVVSPDGSLTRELELEARPTAEGSVDISF
ncbi:MAG: twin-arginine translocation pathway signal protein [Planctomycetes bacterium]|jgi:hypothetical protein|nr:twin-arginine translocation pathway signal protein [Planctomycetota bacterium]MDP6410276.1 alkaline phosphatase D family protein [Planctomycetota bacterium]